MMDDEDLWSDEISAFVDRAFESGIVGRNPSDAEEHKAYRYAIKLAIDESRKHAHDQGYYDGSTHLLEQHEVLREALVDLLHAVCGEKGFAQAVRWDSGRIYPWPALELAEAKAVAALGQSK
jgi:hypothetical protein